MKVCGGLVDGGVGVDVVVVDGGEGGVFLELGLDILPDAVAGVGDGLEEAIVLEATDATAGGGTDYGNELRIYAGADGDFTLYEDQNDGYAYEKGVYATIPIHWDDAKATLTVGERKGNFPGMLESRIFRIVVASEGHGTGIGLTAQPDKIVQYSGKPVTVALQ